MPKKAARGTGHIRQRSDGRWEGMLSLPPDPITGKAKRKSFYAWTQKEVAEKMRQASVEVDTGAYLEPSKMRFGAWLDIWLAEYTVNLKPSTVFKYRDEVEKRIKPAFGSVRLSALSHVAVQKFVNDLSRGAKPLAPSTVIGVHMIIHSALKQAVELKYVKENTADKIKLPKLAQAEFKPLDNDAMSRFLDAAKGNRFERYFIVALFTGMRRSEIAGLKWSAVDLAHGTVNVCSQLYRCGGQYMEYAPKSNKSRTITPASFVMDALKEQRRQQLEWRVAAGPAWNDGDYVFTNEIGKHVCVNTIEYHFKNIVRAIGLPNTRMHDLRHSYTVAAIRSGIDIETLRQNLGHSSAGFTLKVYAAATEEMKREAAQKMDNFIEGLKS